MGNLFSKEKHRSRPSGSKGGGGGGGGYGYSSNEYTGRYQQLPSSDRPKLDPRDAFPQKDWYQANVQQQRRQQYQSQQYQQQQQQQYQQPQQQYQQPQPPAVAAARPTGKRRPQQTAATASATGKIRPEYVLGEIYCLECSRRNRLCPYTPDLNANLVNRSAYVDPANGGARQPWELGIDFCASWKGEQVCKAVTAAAGDAAYQSDDLRASGGGRRRKGAKPPPFSAKKLLGDLEQLGVEFTSSVQA